MLVEKNLVNKLKAFNVNSYEAKLWVALLSRGVSTAGELSDIADVPRSRCYDVLESLEKKGFIITKIGKPIKYLAIPPSDVLERVKKKIMVDANSVVTQLDTIKNTDLMDELTLLHNQGVEVVDSTDLTASLKGRESLYNHIELMIKAAEDSVFMMTTEKGLVRKLELLKSTFQKIHKRGVSIKIAAPITAEHKDLIKEFDFIEFKNISDIKSRFIVVDGKEVVFMLLDDNEIHSSYDVGVWINSSFFANALSQMFLLAFESMPEIKA